ncbi:Ig-like domain-containing protein [Naasia sp. SYSU D00948]|uniref:Ig-like domain-containing protein n=1 Tax=Naasia sp. SYSU D00948 TaxID=2817379 RepID=UPI001B304F6B|nr:Ig-like domain-containing protein [Naasia sp. SYSU D00948]
MTPFPEDATTPERRSPLDSVSPVTRRLFLGGVAGAVGWSVLSGGQAVSAATPSPSPLLPGEYTRKSNQVTAYGGTLYDNIVVKIKGDPARLYVPQSIKPGQQTPIRVVWLYHGSGSDHNALDGGFKQTGERTVDEGAIAICQKAGGTLYSHPFAQACQVNGYAWVAALYRIAGNYLRGTSGGGALSCETYGSRLIPDILGMYNVNGSYDLMAMYNAGGSSRDTVVAAFGDDPAAIQAANPARHRQATWAGTRMRIVVSQPNETDRTVPPEQHGLALLALAAPVAAEASLRTHAHGHSTPGFAHLDFVDAMRRWAPTAPAPDTTAPSVAVTSPSDGAAVAGNVTLAATATDDSSVTGVRFTWGSVDAGAATLANGVWTLPFDTRTAATPDGSYAITATATDAAGNTGVSAPVTVAVRNTDTRAPSVVITSPAQGAVVSGVVTATAAASDDVGVTGVSFYSGSRLIAPASLVDGVWTLTFNTRTSVTPNGTYSITARAGDAAGNVGVSPAVSIRIAN